MNGLANEKLKNIEFLRFIFAILVILFHFKNDVKGYSLTDILPGIEYCTICVDFFFIIAGFFLFKNFNKNMDTMKFAIKKFFRLAPLVWFSLICYIILDIISKYHFSLDSNILRALLLSNIGFSPKVEASIVHWFIPVLFWTMLFYFYIAKIFDKKYLNLIIWMIVMFSLSGYLNYKNFEIDLHTINMCYFFNIGILRGLAGIGIGYFISMLYNTDFLKKASKKVSILLSLIEMFSIGFLGYYMLFSDKVAGKTPFLYTVIFSILFFLFLRKKGVISKILDNNISAILGSSSYAIYIIHPVVSGYFKYLIYKPHKAFVCEHYILYYTILILTAIVSGFIVHYFVENKINKYIKSKNI